MFLPRIYPTKFTRILGGEGYFLVGHDNPSSTPLWWGYHYQGKYYVNSLTGFRLSCWLVDKDRYHCYQVTYPYYDVVTQCVFGRIRTYLNLIIFCNYFSINQNSYWNYYHFFLVAKMVGMTDWRNSYHAHPIDDLYVDYNEGYCDYLIIYQKRTLIWLD